MFALIRKSIPLCQKMCHFSLDSGLKWTQLYLLSETRRQTHVVVAEPNVTVGVVLFLFLRGCWHPTSLTGELWRLYWLIPDRQVKLSNRRRGGHGEGSKLHLPDRYPAAQMKAGQVCIVPVLCLHMSVSVSVLLGRGWARRTAVRDPR